MSTSMIKMSLEDFKEMDPKMLHGMWNKALETQVDQTERLRRMREEADDLRAEGRALELALRNAQTLLSVRNRALAEVAIDIIESRSGRFKLEEPEL